MFGSTTSPIRFLHSQGGQPVSLADTFNQVGHRPDGSTFTGGLDGAGAALSSHLLGPA